MLSTPRRQKYAWAVIAMLAFAAMTGPFLVVTVVAHDASVTRKNTRVIKENSEINKATLDAVVDCTPPRNEKTPPGQCYVRSQSTAKQSIETLVHLFILTTACADRRGSQTPVVIRQCVMQAQEQVEASPLPEE